MSGLLTTGHKTQIKGAIEKVRQTFWNKTVYYYRFDAATTEKDPLYDEARNKAYFDPIEMQTRVSYKQPVGLKIVEGGYDFEFDVMMEFTRDYLIEKGLSIVAGQDSYESAHELFLNDKFQLDGKYVKIVKIIPGTHLDGIYYLFTLYGKFMSDETTLTVDLETWLDIERVTTALGTGIQPIILLDTEGDPRVLWLDDRTGIQNIYEDRRNTSGEWEGNQMITDVTHIVSDFDAFIDSNGLLHLAYIDSSGGVDTQVKYCVFDRITPEITILTTVISLKTNVKIAQTDDGHIHVIWQDSQEHYWHIFRTTLEDGEWSDVEQITNTLGDNVNPSLSVTGNDLVFAWQNVFAGSSNIYVAYYLEGEWYPGTPLIISNEARTPATVSNDQDIYVVWADKRSGVSQIYLKYYISEAWSLEIPLTDGSYDLLDPDVGVSADGKVIIIYRSDLDIYAISYEDGAISQPVMISAEDGNTTYNSDLLVDPQGIPYAVWDDDKFGNFEIFFRKQGS